MQLTRTLLALALSISIALAGKDTDLKPILAKPGKVMAEDSFTTAELKKPWNVAKGDVQIKDGELTETMKKSDDHPAVLILSVPNHNSLIRVSFKCPGNKGFSLSYNSAKGHLFRIQLTGEGLTLLKDKDKKDEKSKSLKLAEASGKITPDEWHTLLVEVQGGKVAVQTDTGLKAEATNSELDVDKTGYRFVTGTSVQLADIKAWQAE